MKSKVDPIRGYQLRWFVNVINEGLQRKGFGPTPGTDLDVGGEDVRPEDICNYNKRNFRKYINAVLKASRQSVA